MTKKDLIQVLALAAESFPDGLPDADGMTIEERVDEFAARLRSATLTHGVKHSTQEQSWLSVYGYMRSFT
jgi:hypothetical protein